MPDKRISVVMITHKPGAHIRLALEHLLELPERPQIIVVDNASCHGTADTTRSLGLQVKVLSLDQNPGCAGWNVGVLTAKTSYVAFGDDESW
jgi:GT2 family glycosyltransferase